MTVRETVNASKDRYGERDLMKVLGDATRVIVAKGKKIADKRETSAKRDWNRQKQRLLKQG